MRLVSTEQVTKYHPDKVCDQISDAVLDACIAQDPESHVACETMMKNDTVIMAGEISTAAKVDYQEVAQRVCRKLGYEARRVITLLDEQSPEINNAVKQGDADQGAGDQGIMFGYAKAGTKSLLPFGLDLANRIIAKIEASTAMDGSILKGDAKTQVTLDIDEPIGLLSVRKILVSACHKETADFTLVKEHIETIIREACQETLGSDAEKDEALKRIEIIINPAGPWTIGGPAADCGLTGRKIVCDQYGGFIPVGGGAFSGKDPSKVDRSASYMARYIACQALKKYRLKECFIQMGYAIGQAEPMSFFVTVDQEHQFMEKQIGKEILQDYDLTPAGIIKTLNLKRPIYEKLAEGCHYREDWSDGISGKE